MSVLQRTSKSGAEEIKKLRKQMGLSPLTKTERRCLRCNRKIISEGVHDRTCWYCRRYPEEGLEEYPLSPSGSCKENIQTNFR